MTSPLDKLGLFVAGGIAPDAEPVRASLEVADIFRAVGPAYRATHAGHR